MSTSTLERLREERDTLIADIEALQDSEDFNPDDGTYTEARSRAESLDTKIRALVEHQQRRNAANEIDAMSVRKKEVVEKRNKEAAEGVSLGELWVRSKSYEDYSQAPRGTSGRVTAPFEAIQKRAPILTNTFDGLIQADRIQPSTAPSSQTPLLDVISRVGVTSNSVEWIFYSAAAPLGVITPEGQPKTEAAITPVLKTVTLNTIASWAQYSRQFGEDAPGLVDFLNASLARGINDKREAEVARVLTTDTDIPVTTNTGTLLEGIRLAIGNIQDAGYSPQIIALNPADYAQLDISLMGMTLGGASINGTFWGVRPVPVGAITTGTAFVGDFSTGMVELVRREVSVYTTDSHASTFVSNVLTTLVEARTVPIVHRPEALTKVTGTVAAAGGTGTGGENVVQPAPVQQHSAGRSSKAE